MPVSLAKSVNFVYKTLLLPAIFAFSSLRAASFLGERPYYFQHLEVEDGLSQNMVYCILQDRQGFMWFGTQSGLNRYDGQRFKVYRKENGNPKSIGSNGLLSIVEDAAGMIWVGTMDGVYRYDPSTDAFSHLTTRTPEGEGVSGIVRCIREDDEGRMWMAATGTGIFSVDRLGAMRLYTLPIPGGTASNIRDLEFDAGGHVWAATYGHGLFRLDPLTGATRQYLPDRGGYDLNDLFPLDQGTFLVGTVAGGILTFDLAEGVFKPFLSTDREGNALFIRKIMRSQKGDLWFCSETGVYIHNPRLGTWVNLRQWYGDPYSLSDNAVHSICEDRENGIWLGTYFGGVNYINDFSSRFEKFYPVGGGNSISGKSVSEFCQDDTGRIWIGTEDAGLNRFDPRTWRFDSGFLPAKNVHALLCRKGQLWVGTFSDGLFRIDLGTMRTRSYKSAGGTGSDIDNVYALHCDRSQSVWIGTMSGLYRYKELTDGFERILPDRITAQVNDILEDSYGVLWAATIGDGIFACDRQRNAWKNYGNLLTDGDMTGTRISCILEDSRRRLWIGTEGCGVYCYDREKDAFLPVLTERNGLPNNVIYRLIEDLHGTIWGSTDKGLFRYDPASRKTETFDHTDGLIGDQFNYKSGFRSTSGKIYFGGIKGFVAFSPEKIPLNDKVPPVVINSFHVYNEEVDVGVGKKPLLRRAITHTRKITLPHDISSFSLGFAALSYVSPKGNEYAYRLEGWEREWLRAKGDRQQATYSNIPPGSYLFRVKAANSDGVWNDEGASLEIEILPPFYRTVAAYAAYVLLAVAALILTIRLFIRRNFRRQEIRRKEFEMLKEKELYDAKMGFFTNITHEIRTPLSLIKLPLDEVLANMDRSDPNLENLSIVQRNANRLLKLVNELLDFRKAEAGGLEVHLASTDIAAIVEMTVERFRSSVRLRGLDLALDMPPGPLYADVDVEMMTKIVSNLMSNALKHASRHIGIRLEPTAEVFRLIVTNDGDRIEPKYAEKIFLPFFKIDEHLQGSGIGLPFIHALAQLHHGTIRLGPHPKGWTVFEVEIPLSQSGAASAEAVDAEPPAPASDALPLPDEAPAAERGTILLVEDNDEFRSFLTRQLAGHYKVFEADDGRRALDLLESHYVDIILTDIMMPVMDGMALCRAVKEDIRFSHIPIIMLTARTSIQSKLDSWKIGADEYIEKPFSTDFLKVRIENLLANRRKTINSYKHSPEVAIDTITSSKADENFLHRLVGIIYSRIEEVDLSVDDLADAMSMSRATFYRKVKSLSEQTPNDFIRLIRLKRAAELLRDHEYRVNEIAFIVGFSSASYFSKCFCRQFGVLPKDFEKQARKKQPGKGEAI